MKIDSTAVAREWFVFEILGDGGSKAVLQKLLSSSEATVFAFTKLELLFAFLRERKPEGVTISAASYEPLTQLEFENGFLKFAGERSKGRVIYFSVDPPPAGGEFPLYSIDRYLRRAKTGDPVALENSREML